MAMNPTNGMAAGQPGTGNPFAGRSGQVPAAQDVQGRQAPREEQAAQPIGPKQLSEATQVLLKYKSGKAALDRRIVENEHWYRLHRDTEDGNFADSGWMFNSLANKHADAMDNYPEPNVLPRARDDADTAKELSSILPVALDQNDYEQVYSDAWWYKLKHGTAVKGVFWNGAKDGGLGDIDLRLVDLLNLYWEPGITDIQASRNVFHVELVDNEVILEQWPFAKNHLGQGLTAQRYQYDESIDTSDKSLVVDWYYKRRGVLHYCKYVGECVLYASENDAQYAERGYYDHGKYPFVFDVLFPMAGSPAGFGMIDVMQSAQAAIDRLDKAIVRNADIASRVRYFARDTGSVNETEFADLDKDFVHCAGDVGEDSLRQIVVNPLADIYATILNNKISELKETSGNRDYSQGATTSGVTAASAIAALQEAGSKLSRDMLKSAYTVSVGSDGPFTGAAVQLGYVLFFKENCLHKVYGSKPSNFQVSMTACEGVQPGSAKSLCMVGSTLYYKADHGVMAYDGSVPESVSAALGGVYYQNAVAGTERGRLYLSMQDAAESWHLFVYDTETGIWCREDAAHAAAFATLNGNAYMLDADGCVWKLTPAEGEATEGPVRWMAETGMLDPYVLDAHYTNRLQIRLWLPEGSRFAVWAQYDDGDWQRAADFAGRRSRSVFLPVILRRCDHVRLRLCGVGPCKVYAMSRVTATGSERRERDSLNG